MLQLLHFHWIPVDRYQTDQERDEGGCPDLREIRKMGIPIQFLDVGGGMVDYDGSHVLRICKLQRARVR
jgi:arginine decarboxylase-like protein